MPEGEVEDPSGLDPKDLFPSTRNRDRPSVEEVGLDDRESIGLGLPGELFDLKCPECQGIMRLKRSKHGLFYGCENWPDCQGTHGAHPDGRPLGTPADAKTKRQRIQAHRVFDRLWTPYNGQEPRMTRPQAYTWMRRAMKISEAEAHISRFNTDQCLRLIELVKKKYPGIQTIWDRLGDDDD